MAYSPTELDKFESKVKDEPNNRSGTSKDTGLFFSKITISSVVVGLWVDVVFGAGLLPEDELG